MTDARPTSDPVPDVVGTPIVGAMPDDVHARVPILTIFEIPDRPRLTDHQCNGLAGVERAATTESDHTVVLAAAIRSHASSDVCFDRVCLHVAEYFADQSRFATCLDGACNHRQGGEAGIGDDAAVA